jgi:predicted dehydrogenase
LKNVPASVELYRAGNVQQITSPQCNWTWAFRRQARAFVEDILEGRPSLSPGAEALEDLRLCEQMWRVELDRKRG